MTTVTKAVSIISEIVKLNTKLEKYYQYAVNNRIESKM